MAADPHTLVLLHPFPMDASFWGPMWREMDAPDVTVLTPELPGFGAAPAVPEPSIAGFADSVAELIRGEGGPATVVGLSLGGYAALALVAEHPDTVAGLVLASTRADADGPDARRARERAIDQVRIDGLEPYLQELLPRLLGPDAPAEAWERAHAAASSQDPESVCAALEALRDRPDRRADLAAIGVPTVVVAGADDQVTPPEATRALADGIPGADLRVIPGAGHLSALEQPRAFAAIVAGALAASSGAAR